MECKYEGFVVTVAGAVFSSLLWMLPWLFRDLCWLWKVINVFPVGLWWLPSLWRLRGDFGGCCVRCCVYCDCWWEFVVVIVIMEGVVFVVANIVVFVEGSVLVMEGFEVTDGGGEVTVGVQGCYGYNGWCRFCVCDRGEFYGCYESFCCHCLGHYGICVILVLVIEGFFCGYEGFMVAENFLFCVFFGWGRFCDGCGEFCCGCIGFWLLWGVC